MIWSSVMREAMASSAGPRMSADAAERVAVAALLVLEDERALAFEGRAVLEVGGRGGIAGPGFHDGAPRRVGAEVGEDAEGDGDDGDHQHGNGTARPVLSPSPATSGRRSMAPMTTTGAMKQEGRLELGRQKGENGVDPEKGEVGLGRGLDDGGIGSSGGAEGAEEERAGHDGEEDGGGEDGVFPCGVGDEGDAGLGGELVVLALVGGLADDAAGHGPLVDAEVEHHPDMHGDEGRAACRE